MKSALCVAALAASAGLACAGPINLAYSGLDGSYDGAGSFSASAVGAGNPFLSSGRVFEDADEAVFNAGFKGTAGLSDFLLELSDTGFGVPDVGTFLASDVQGDLIGGDVVAGTWTQNFGILTFTGSIANAFVLTADGSFDGEGGSSLAIANAAGLTGAVVTIAFDFGAGFNAPFSGRTTTVGIQLVPTPGALALLGVGGLAVSRRRR